MAMALTDAHLRQMNVVRPDSMIFIGVDLGKRENYSAIVVLERFEIAPDFTDVLRGVGFRALRRNATSDV